MSNKRNSPKRQLPKKRKKMTPSVKRPAMLQMPIMSSDEDSAEKLSMLSSMMTQQFGPDWQHFTNVIGKQTTPKAVTPRLQAFAKTVAGSECVTVPVQPVAPAMRCHVNVLNYCDQHPGAEPVYGWIIWENESFAEGEFHAVIRENGKLVCITDMPDGERELVFFEDRKRRPKIEAFGDKDYIVHTFFNVHIDTGDVHPRIGMLLPNQLETVSIPAIV